nr:ATP-binding protein [Motiliproteus sp. SC1-56]
MNRPFLAPHGVGIEQVADPQLAWSFDRALVQGVISSVLSNVIRYGDGQVCATARQLRLAADEKDGYLRLTVEDDGPGFPEALVGPLEAHRMGVDFISGSTGFGLYFALQVARLHGEGERRGHIRLSNGGALGGGCFELFLP